LSPEPLAVTAHIIAEMTPQTASMTVETATLSGVLIFRPTPHIDERGFFSRTFDVDVARAAGIDPVGFAQDSMSRSHRGVIRGLHIRVGKGEAKLVRCSFGAIFDVAVDLRRDSPTYLQWESFTLTGDEQTSVYIPAGCAHGFQALTEPADISYRIDQPHNPEEDLTIAHDDPRLDIRWPLSVTIMSDRDRMAPALADLAQLPGMSTHPAADMRSAAPPSR
jgi:dTDP-4-dehydrorhamnose 3,5-epimerase